MSVSKKKISSHEATLHSALFSSESEVVAFTRSLSTTHIGKPLHYFEQTTSTNDLALSAARTGGKHGSVFIAEQQVKGRGRGGREWHSPARRGLLLSVIIRPSEIAPADLGWIPLLAGLAAAEAMREICGFSACIKWPNDVVLPVSAAKNKRSKNFPGWHKLGGILCESSLCPGDPSQSFVVVGIGLNINHAREDFPPQTKAPPTSAALECGRKFDRKTILAALLRQLEKRLLQLGNIHERARLCQDIEAALRRWWTPEHLLVVNPKAGDEKASLLEGTFAGLDSFGRLGLNLNGVDKIQFLADAEILKILTK